jgi:hypothetical protein
MRLGVKDYDFGSRVIAGLTVFLRALVAIACGVGGTMHHHDGIYNDRISYFGNVIGGLWHRDRTHCGIIVRRSLTTDLCGRKT